MHDNSHQPSLFSFSSHKVQTLERVQGAYWCWMDLVFFFPFPFFSFSVGLFLCLVFASTAAGQFTLSGYACKECPLFVPTLGPRPSSPSKTSATHTHTCTHAHAHTHTLFFPQTTLSVSPHCANLKLQITKKKRGGQGSEDKHHFKKQVSRTFQSSSISNGDPLTSALFWLVAEVASQRPNQSRLTMLGGWGLSVLFQSRTDSPQPVLLWKKRGRGSPDWLEPLY